jgi:hypothetical protein
MQKIQTATKSGKLTRGQVFAALDFAGLEAAEMAYLIHDEARRKLVDIHVDASLIVGGARE